MKLRHEAKKFDSRREVSPLQVPRPAKNVRTSIKNESSRIIINGIKFNKSNRLCIVYNIISIEVPIFKLFSLPCSLSLARASLRKKIKKCNEFLYNKRVFSADTSQIELPITRLFNFDVWIVTAILTSKTNRITRKNWLCVLGCWLLLTRRSALARVGQETMRENGAKKTRSHRLSVFRSVIL